MVKKFWIPVGFPYLLVGQLDLHCWQLLTVPIWQATAHFILAKVNESPTAEWPPVQNICTVPNPANRLSITTIIDPPTLWWAQEHFLYMMGPWILSQTGGYPKTFFLKLDPLVGPFQIDTTNIIWFCKALPFYYIMSPSIKFIIESFKLFSP